MPSDFADMLWEVVEREREKYEVEMKMSIALAFLLDRLGGYILVTEKDCNRIAEKYGAQQIIAENTSSGIVFKFSSVPTLGPGSQELQ